MRKTVRFVMAAVLGAGAVVWFAGTAATAEDRPGPGTPMPATKPSAPLTFPAGITQKDLGEQKDIYNALEAVTEAAWRKGGFDAFVNRLVDADRVRIGDFKDRKFDQLDGRIDALTRDWRSKYNQDFDVKEEYFTPAQFARVLQGEISDPTQLAGRWPVQAYTELGAMAQPAGERTGTVEPGKVEESKKLFGGDVNLNKGRNVALVRLSASHGLPEVTCSLIHELPDIWRFDIPDHITGQKLHDNLLNRLTWLGEHKDQWPADTQEAYRYLAHHVVMALYDVPMTGGLMERAIKAGERMTEPQR